MREDYFISLEKVVVNYSKILLPTQEKNFGSTHSYSNYYFTISYHLDIIDYVKHLKILVDVNSIVDFSGVIHLGYPEIQNFNLTILVDIGMDVVIRINLVVNNVISTFIHVIDSLITEGCYLLHYY